MYLNFNPFQSFYARREIKQYHMTVWPDKSIPASAVVMASFLRMIREMVAEREMLHPMAPLLVHCGAGVGRTGTFIAINELLDQIIVKGPYSGTP